MSRPTILIQLDGDEHASVFDAVVATDAGVDRLLQYSRVEATQVRDLVHGAMFTRGPADLKSTAIFIGGANVAKGEELLRQVVRCFFGPMRVSVMMDANGANTTAAAAVIAAGRHVDLAASTATVLAATGPVGQRVVRLLAGRGAQVRVASRDRSRAALICELIAKEIPGARLTPHSTDGATATAEALQSSQVVIAAGAAGIGLASAADLARAADLPAAVDLDARRTIGLEGIEVTDRAVERNGRIDYGAIGVGGTKMKIHKAALRRLFESNDQVLDAEAIYAIGAAIDGR